MFTYLSKKIAIPNNTKLYSLGWSQYSGQIGCGGEHGLLKVIKLEDPNAAVAGAQPTGALSLNHTLEGHSGITHLVTWNEQFQKLTTADENGLIIVWMLHQNCWFEEMINNRNKSFVVDMKWSKDGTRICICYEDGAVILGSVEGSRLWGKEFKHRIQIMEWSPDGRMMVIGTPEGEIKIYDDQGTQLQQIKIYCLQKIVPPEKYFTPGVKLAAVQWYEKSKMHTDETPPGLIIAYECGRVQLMKNDNDDDPILIDTSLIISDVKWNPSGTMFAVSGSMSDGPDQIKRGTVQFFNNAGIHLRSIRIPQSDKIGTVSWEGTGLRLALIYGWQIYFANIKQDYKWAYLANDTLVFSYQKSDRIDFCIVFWSIKNDRKNIKYVKYLQAIKAYGDFCIIIAKVEDAQDTYNIQLCNSIGSIVDQRVINIEPMVSTMTATHIFVCSYDYVYMWQYRTASSRISAFTETTKLDLINQTKKMGKENAFYIDDNPDPTAIYDNNKFNPFERETDDPVCAISANESQLFIARMSGSIHKYSLPQISLENKQFVKCKPNFIFQNSDSTKLAVIDINGFLSLYEVNHQGGTLLEIERKDVWNVIWASDNAQSFACMEKSRLYTYKDKEAEEPVLTEAYFCKFQNLQIRCVLLDEVMKSPDGNLKASELIIDHETKALRDTRDILNKVSFADAYEFIKTNPHKKLWEIMVAKGLEQLNFPECEKAFIQLNDYQGLQFLKRIQLIDDKEKQKAEIAIYYQKYDEAEAIYKKIERKDLIIDLRMKIGDYERVVEMVKPGSGMDDKLQMAHSNLGEVYADKFDWHKAAEHFMIAKNYEKLIDACFNIEDYSTIKKVIQNIPEGNKELLIDLGDRLQQVGLGEYATICFQRAGEIKRAIDACVLLNQWNLAVELAERHNYMQIESLITNYANQLLEQRRKLEAAELYRKSNRNTESARIFKEIAEDLISHQANPVMIKKLFVMTALEVELHKKRVFDVTMTGGKTTTAKTLESLITSDINTSTEKMLNNPWRGAEAWHFYCLAMRQLYEGKYDAALKTSVRLTEYELELETKKVYSVLALASYYNSNFKICSQSFVKLENMEQNSEEDTEIYEDMASDIFRVNSPADSKFEKVPCPGKTCSSQVTKYDTHCNICGSNFQPCMASGSSILKKEYYTCKMCRHKMLDQVILEQQITCCALCHAPVVDFALKQTQQQEI